MKNPTLVTPEGTKVDRVELSYKSFDEINAVREAIESDPENLMPEGSFYRFKLAPRKKLDDIAWAVTNKIERERKIAISAPVTQKVAKLKGISPKPPRIKKAKPIKLGKMRSVGAGSSTGYTRRKATRLR